MRPKKDQPFLKEKSASKRRGKPTPATLNRSSPRKLWLFRATAVVVVPVLLLLTAEVALRLSGYGYDPGFFHRTVINGEQYWVQNDRFGLRFFPPRLARYPGCILMKADKPTGTQRIFILGESAAMGDPAPRFAASRYLEALLKERYPASSFEIINTGLTAINSHAILPIARECAARDGDIWILYMGNNEMIGPYGAATIFGPKSPSLAFVRWSLAVQRTRIGQAIMDLSRNLKNSDAETGSWGGMKMFLNNSLPPGDPRREVVYESFSENLQDIIRVGMSAGARIILSSVAVNLKDCSPFASAASGLDSQELEVLRHQLTNGAPQALLTACEERLRAALETAPESADLHYLLGESLVLQGKPEGARKFYQAALDNDSLPFRADTRINIALESAARNFESRGVSFSDAADSLAGESPHHIPGEESFYEHVHLNFKGNYHLALAWAAQVESVLPERLQADASSVWADQATCEQRLALTDWNRQWVIEEVLRRFEQPPLSAQASKPKQIAALRHQLALLQKRIETSNPEEAHQVYLQAIRQSPQDYRLHENYADFLEAIGDYKGGLEQRQRVVDLIPHYYFAHFSLGTLLKEQRQFQAAQASLERAAEINPTQPDIRLHLGSVYALQKAWDKALAEFELGRKLDPNEPRFWHMKGDVFWRMDRRNESIQALRKAVQMAPDYWEARYRLAEVLGLSGNYDGASQELYRVLELRPDHERARINLGVALLKGGRAREAVRQFELVLAANPRNDVVQGFRQEALAQAERTED